MAEGGNEGDEILLLAFRQIERWHIETSLSFQRHHTTFISFPHPISYLIPCSYALIRAISIKITRTKDVADDLYIDMKFPSSLFSQLINKPFQ